MIQLVAQTVPIKITLPRKAADYSKDLEPCSCSNLRRTSTKFVLTYHARDLCDRLDHAWRLRDAKRSHL